MEPVGEVLVQEAQSGPAYLLGTGGAIRLDGMRFRKIVLQSVDIYYDGGPLALEDVVFINCRFIMDDLENGHALGNALLSASSLTLEIKEKSPAHS